MPICYVLGGLGESVLSRDPGGAGVVWIDLAVLMLGKAGETRLAPNGSDPGPPDGVPLFATAVPGPYVGFPAAVLGTRLALSGYSTRVHWFDWRKTLYPAGVALAARIRQEVTAADPCSIVAHSAGGIVARAAWTDLGTTGQQNLVRRIVTCGTPHWGSYTVVQFWCGESATIDLLNYWNQQVGYNTAGWAPDITGYVYRDTLFYRRLALTWPSFYDCLPVLGAPNAADDPNRVLLYDAATWPAEARPQQAWLDWSRDHTGPWLRSAASQPPAHVLTCLSGYGRTSPAALVSAAQLGQAGAFGNNEDGDGTVVRSSSALASGVLWSYPVDHENWLPTYSNTGDLAELVLEHREPGPPPPPEVSTEPQQTAVQPLPFEEALNSPPSRSVCVGGTCYC